MMLVYMALFPGRHGCSPLPTIKNRIRHGMAEVRHMPCLDGLKAGLDLHAWMCNDGQCCYSRFHFLGEESTLKLRSGKDNCIVN